MSIHDEEERKISPFLSTLSSEQIVDAVNHSTDNGVTLFLSKLGICEIGSRGAEELAAAGHLGHQEEGSTVERLALGYNRLTALPSEFELFTRLRYINLKHNMFTVFPTVLTKLPCLDTLDIGHNKIRNLPLNPGNLVRLRVFCLTRNKITRLPTYLSQFRKLDVLQIDRNPIIWPPTSAMEQLGEFQGLHNGKEWILKLQNWLEADGAKDKEYDDSGYSEQPEWEPERSYDDPWGSPLRQGIFDAGLTPHARSFSVDSISSIPDSPLLSDTEQKSNNNQPISSSGRNENENPAVQFSQISENYSTDMFSAPSPMLSKPSNGVTGDAEQTHLRTTSYASILRKPYSNPMVPKQSLPDLRMAHKDLGKQVPPLPQIPYAGGTLEEPSIHHPALDTQDSELISTSHAEHSRISDGRSHPFVAAERSSYFQRLLSIQPTTNNLPRPLVCLVETARSILFSMGQLHQTLDRCAHHGAFERTSLKFKKALDPANMTMLHLIRSLDRFDDVSQQSLPSPAVCRGLVECCRDTVTAYRKSLALLVNQTTQEPSADARFTRLLILEMYGINAEICFAWQTMAPEIEPLRPFISNNLYSQFSAYSNTGNPVVQLQALKPAVRLRSSDNGIAMAGRSGKARRHAGSFSSKDVQIGKELPSYDIIPITTGRLATQALNPTLRTPKRQITVPILSTPSSLYFPPTPSSSLPNNSDYIHNHLRQNSQSSTHDSPSLISPTTSLESPSDLRPFSGKDVRQALQTAVEVAPIVWDHLEKVLSDVLIIDNEIRETLDSARSATTMLARNVADLYEEDIEPDRRLLRENAYTFLKIVLQLSNILKTHGNPRSVTPSLRSNMVKLANSTQEFANILQFPSISYTPRSSSPTLLPKYSAYNSSPYHIQDNQLGFSLSRTPSAQLPSIHKLPVSSNYELQPILPLSIKTSGARRMRAAREASIDGTDPG